MPSETVQFKSNRVKPISDCKKTNQFLKNF